MISKKYFRIITRFRVAIQNICKHHSLVASSLHVNPCVDAYSLQFHHLNSTVTCEAINIAFLPATSADSIDELGITDDNGLSDFGTTMPIFIGFFASTHLKYFNSTILKLPKKYFRKWLVIFEIFVHKLIWKLLRIRYGIPTVASPCKNHICWQIIPYSDSWD